MDLRVRQIPSRPYAHFQDRVDSLSSLKAFVISVKAEHYLSPGVIDRRSRFTGVFGGQQQGSKPKATGRKGAWEVSLQSGNMSGKTIDSGKPELERRANIDRIKSCGKQPHSRDD